MMPAPGPLTRIDWVDEVDRPVAEVRRGEVFRRRGVGFRVVHIFVFNERGDLLVQQLGENRDRNPLKLGSSVAGYLNLGEEYLDGARRRLKEELGLTTPLAKFGNVVMPDQQARKFITLYITTAPPTAPIEADRGHIKTLFFERLPVIREQIDQQPEDFTETFRFLFQFFLSTVRLKAYEEWRNLGGLVPNLDV